MWNVNSSERAVAVLILAAALSVAERGVAAQAPGQSDTHALLDVPYMTQTPELCGGAAVAMVLRYWGERGVFPQDFAPLVSASDGGILTGVLASAVRSRGWQALVVPAADDTARARIRSEIDQGRPLIALIEVAPHTYHYVVIVGQHRPGGCVARPGARAFRVLRWAEFDRAWAATGRWMMLVLPPDGFRKRDEAAPATTAAPDVAVHAVHAAETPCSALVESGVQLALAGDLDGAEQGLVAATALCPDDPAAWRELAGLRFSQSRWREAQDLARSAARLAPDDAYAWLLVATSRYLMGDLMGALDAWNHRGEPRIDTIDIHGVERTRQPIIIRVAGLQPGQLLTPAVFERALRRLRELPVASNARMTFDGIAKVDIFIDERPVVPSGWPAIAALGARTIVLSELRVDVAGPMGEGELASVAWRWSAARPRVAIDLALPSPLPGIVSSVVTVGGSWERQSYNATPASPGATVVREERRRVGLRVADWSTGRLRWQAGAALDRLHEYDDSDRQRFNARDYLAVESALDVRLAGDRLALTASGGWWAPFAGGDRFATGGLRAAWRSSRDAMVPAWSAASGIAVASRVAPLALWQGAGTGQGRTELLRAHPLLDDDVVTGPVFGRDVAHGSLEYARPVGHTLAGGLSIAAFVDGARAWHRLSGLDPSPLYIDAGVGVRVHAPGPGGALRIDVAHGLRGGGTTLSAGWLEAWPQ